MLPREAAPNRGHLPSSPSSPTRTIVQHNVLRYLIIGERQLNQHRLLTTRELRIVARHVTRLIQIRRNEHR